MCEGVGSGGLCPDAPAEDETLRIPLPVDGSSHTHTHTHRLHITTPGASAGDGMIKVDTDTHLGARGRGGEDGTVEVIQFVTQFLDVETNECDRV